MKRINIPSAMLERLQSQLQPAEKLVWVGMPDWRHIPDSPHSKSGWMMWGLLAYWSSLAAVAFLAARALLSPLMLIGLVTAGIVGTVLANIFIRVIAAYRQVYALTTRRALILSGKRLQSYSGSDIAFIECVMHTDGTGDILFRHAMLPRTMIIGAVTAQQSIPHALGFFGVSHPQDVESLMLQTFRMPAETRRAAQQAQVTPAEWEHAQQI